MAAKVTWTGEAINGTPGYNSAANNSIGFSALPGGFRDINGELSYQGLTGN